MNDEGDAFGDQLGADPAQHDEERQLDEAQRQLIEDLLDTSRISSGKVRLDLRPTEVCSVLRQALEDLRGILRVLRTPEAAGTPGRDGDPASPQPRLADVGRLVAERGPGSSPAADTAHT